MPLQNRVDPFGRIVATPERGKLTGNRGIIHDESQRIVRSHALKAWISCLLRWKDRSPRQVMTGRKWTELFFLDEPTALAAGHRPCGYCRRPDYERFVAAWSQGNPALAPPDGRRAPVVDATLHRERRRPDGTKRTFRGGAPDLPPGTMFADEAGRAWLVAPAGLALPWSFAGYGPGAPLPAGRVDVLTPPSTVNAIRAGYAVALPAT